MKTKKLKISGKFINVVVSMVTVVTMENETTFFSQKTKHNVKYTSTFIFFQFHVCIPFPFFQRIIIYCTKTSIFLTQTQSDRLFRSLFLPSSGRHSVIFSVPPSFQQTLNVARNCLVILKCSNMFFKTFFNRLQREGREK